MNNPGYFSVQGYFFNPCGPLPSSVTCASGSGTSNPNALQYYGSDPNPQPPFSDSCGYLGSFDTQVCQGFGANQLQCNYQGGTSGRKVSYIFNAAPTVGMPVPSETNYPQYQVVFSGPIKATDPEPPVPGSPCFPQPSNFCKYTCGGSKCTASLAPCATPISVLRFVPSLLRAQSTMTCPPSKKP